MGQPRQAPSCSPRLAAKSLVCCPSHPNLTALYRSEDFLSKARRTFPDHNEGKRHAWRMKIYAKRLRPSTQPQARSIYRTRPLAVGSLMPDHPTIIVFAVRRAISNEVLQCAHSICSKQHTYSGSILKSFDNVRKLGQSPEPRLAVAGSSSKRILSSISARSMLLLGKRCK